ncbi:hypothetical protein ALC60_03100, partial [Trachymyrmex zeteki]
EDPIMVIGYVFVDERRSYTVAATEGVVGSLRGRLRVGRRKCGKTVPAAVEGSGRRRCRGAGGPNGREGRQRQARRGVETQRAARGGKPSCTRGRVRGGRGGGRGRPDGEWVYGGMGGRKGEG